MDYAADTNESQSKYDDLARALKIGVALDSEVAEHAELYYHVCVCRVLAVERRDAVKIELGELRAQLQHTIREELADQNVRITEAIVGAAIDDSPSHKEKARQYLAATSEALRWDALRDAYNQRSYMLKSLVDLAVSGNAAVSIGGSNNRVDEVIAETGRVALRKVRKPLTRGRERMPNTAADR